MTAMTAPHAMTALDRRRNAFRADLADRRLAGRVDAARFADPVRRAVTAPLAGCHVRPDPAAPLDTEFLHGEPVDVFAAADGWCWVQSAVDGYVGYVRAAMLGPVPVPTHRVAAPLALVFPERSIKVPPFERLPMGALIEAGEAEPAGSERFQATSGGYVLAQHLAPLGAAAPDWVEVATLFVGTPYLWGGKSWLGIDCSGLVQLALQAAGRPAPRDSDMQAAELGAPADGPPLRGDLMFWNGHVGIMLDAERLLHANGHWHQAVIEPLGDVVARHRAKGLSITARRRLAAAASPSEGSGAERRPASPGDNSRGQRGS